MKISELEAYLNSYGIKNGTVLTIGKRTMQCIGQEGDKYLFDNGMRWSKASIVKNVVKCIQDGESWGIK